MANMGRPSRGGAPRNVSFQTSITKEMSDKLWKCADILGVYRTDVLERGIDMVYAELMKDKLPQ